MITACLLFALFFGAVVFIAVAPELGERLTDARAESARLTREHDAELAARDATIAELDQENARLHAELTAAQVGRHLRVVPPPSDDEWFGRLYDENGGHRG